MNSRTIDPNPVLRAFRGAPVGPPMSKDERSVVEESERCIAAGERGQDRGRDRQHHRRNALC